jgi:hypothetical protein
MVQLRLTDRRAQYCERANTIGTLSAPLHCIETEGAGNMFTSAKYSVSCLSAVAFIGIASASRIARADLSDCGDISLEADADCTVVPPTAGCDVMCTPISVRAACSAKLAASCEASCDKLPSVACSGRCVADCTGQCTVDPGKFDCEAACRADCDGQCSAQCEGKSDKVGCMAQCNGACSVSCKGSCDVKLPDADCDAKCQAGCEGSCKVDTNFDCQASCQSKGYAKCQADVQGSCKAKCKAKEGALFCDGQFVDNGDNLDMCIDALKAAFNAKVSVKAESHGESACDGGTCEASGSARVSSDCSNSRAGSPANIWALFALVSAMLAYVLRLRNP